MDFCKWLTDRREGLRLSQAACARGAGMSPQQWNQIEKRTGRPDFETVRKVASGLGISEGEALEAAGYIANVETPGEQISRIISRMSSDKQRIAVKLLETLAIA